MAVQLFLSVIALLMLMSIGGNHGKVAITEQFPRITRRAIHAPEVAVRAILFTCAFPIASRASERSECKTPEFGQELTIHQAADFIRSDCSVVLNAVKATGRLMYRGESAATIATQQPLLQNPKLDLLLPETYSAPLALDFFKTLADRIERIENGWYLASPANAHIVAADIQVASEWGTPVSVWPLDAGLHYAWLRRDLNWWDPSWATPQGKRGPFFWRSEERLDDFITNDVRFDSGLEAVLAKGGEVMFTTASQPFNCGQRSKNDGVKGWFVSVPLQLEPQLLRLLEVTPFSSNTKVVEGRAMQMEGAVTRKFYISPTLR